MTQSNWKYRPMLRGSGKRVRVYPRGLTCIYPLEVIERIRAAQAADAVPEPIPDGFVDKAGAAGFFGITVLAWKNWIREGKVRCGRNVPHRFGGKRTLYAIEDLHRLKAELFDESRVHQQLDGTWHVPDGYFTREQACEQFGVSLQVWWRWEREGKITCGHRFGGGPKLYKLDDIHRLLDGYGKYCPPYPDPEVPDVYRVPLSGRDIKRREALVDADTLPLIEGASLSWSSNADGSAFVSFTGPGRHCAPLRRVILGVSGANVNVRHLNGDALDCRRANLVVRTIEQRTRNMRKAKAINGRRPTSRFKGVHWSNNHKGWRAAIHMGGRKRTLGTYTDEIAAAVAYDEAAREWFGEHARLNFPEGVDAWLEAEGYTPAARAAA